MKISGRKRKFTFKEKKEERRKLENTSTAEPSTNPGIRY